MLVMLHTNDSESCCRTIALAKVLLLVVSISTRGQVAPSDEETYLLQQINALRADPIGVAQGMAPGPGNPIRVRGLPTQVDWAMFWREIRALRPTPPLVFNPHLIEAARLHSQYQATNREQGHAQTPGKPGYTGSTGGQRIKAAGYPGRGLFAENVNANAWGLDDSLLSFVVDWGPGEGGMQPGRGHRVAMMAARFREAGMGVVRHEAADRPRQRFAVTHLFSDRQGVPRFVGGVIYRDRNGNDQYDPGEGVGDAAVAAADPSAKTTTWPSGAFALELSNQDAAEVSVTVDNLTRTVHVAAGRENVGLDWRVPTAAASRRIDPLIAAAKQGGVREAARLYDAAQADQWDDARQSAIDALTMDVFNQAQQAKAAIRNAAVDGDAAAFREAITQARPALTSRLNRQWLQDARLAMRFVGATTKRDGASTTAKEALATQLLATRFKLRSADWRRVIDTWLHQLAEN